MLTPELTATEDDTDGLLRVVDGSELEQTLHMTIEQVDRRVFGPLHSVDAFGSAAVHQAWFHRNPSIFTFLLAGSKVVGYANAMPLTDAAFAEVLAGNMKDGLILPEMIRRYDAPGDYNLYFCSLALLPDFRNRAIGVWSLYTAFQEKIEAARVQGVNIAKIAAVVWSKEGRIICHAFGMQFLRPHSIQGDVYLGELIDGRFPNVSRYR